MECRVCGKQEAAPQGPMLMGGVVQKLRAFSFAHAWCDPDLPERALSLRQPWAWLMLRPDLVDYHEREAARELGLIKDVENRPLRWAFRGRILVHASATMTKADYEAAAILAATMDVYLPEPGELERGGVVGEFTITDCVTEHASPWFFGPFGYPVKDARPLPFRACKGMLGLFRPHFDRTEVEG